PRPESAPTRAACRRRPRGRPGRRRRRRAPRARRPGARPRSRTRRRRRTRSPPRTRPRPATRRRATAPRAGCRAAPGPRKDRGRTGGTRARGRARTPTSASARAAAVAFLALDGSGPTENVRAAPGARTGSDVEHPSVVRVVEIDAGPARERAQEAVLRPLVPVALRPHAARRILLPEEVGPVHRLDPLAHHSRVRAAE